MGRKIVTNKPDCYKSLFKSGNCVFPECGVSKIPQARIVGGNATFEGQYPWMVAIYLHGNGKKEFWCGGNMNHFNPKIVFNFFQKTLNLSFFFAQKLSSIIFKQKTYFCLYWVRVFMETV